MSTIIGLVGLIGSGKGTVGDLLVQKHGFIQESFAKPLKDAVALIFNWPRDLLEGNTDEGREWRNVEDVFWSAQLGKSMTPRLALQLFGTEAGRNVFGENIWTSALINRLLPLHNYVITDVRFDNEVKAIRRAGGIIVRIKRGPEPGWMESAQLWLRSEGKAMREEDQWRFDDILAHLPHRSEWDWVNSTIDFTITNDGTLEELEAKVEQIRHGELHV